MERKSCFSLIKSGRTFIFFLGLIILFTLIIGPIFWVFINSFKTNVDALASPPALFFKPIISNYIKVLKTFNFNRAFFNSLIVALASTTIVLIFGTPAAYVLARFRFKGKLALSFMVLASRMIPTIAIGIPMYMIMKKFKMLDTQIALIASYVAFNLPFGIWLLTGFIKMIPKELEEAASIDGCTRFQAFRRVILPLLGPGLAAVGILISISCYREFFLPLILTSQKAKPLSVLAGQFITEYGTDWGQLSAFAIIIFVPVIVIAVYAQRYLISGLTMGAVKG